MNRYEPSKPRAVLALTAVAMTAITLGGLVVLPATLDADGPDPFAFGVAHAATIAAIEVPEVAPPEQRSTPVALLSVPEQCAGSIEKRARVAQPIPNAPERTFSTQHRAITMRVLTKEMP